MAEIARRTSSKQKRTVIYTHRRILIDQTSGVLSDQDVSHGILAAGYQKTILPDVFIASVQTIASRVYESEKWKLPDAHTVMVDEAHSNTAYNAQRIIGDHLSPAADSDYPRSNHGIPIQA